MKRSVYLWLILAVAAFALIGGAAALAAQGKAAAPQTMMGQGMMGMGGLASSGMMGAGGPGRSGMMGGCPMGGATGGAALTVSSDGVYVLAGTTLLKYDKNLKPVGETEIKPEAWAKATGDARTAWACPGWQQSDGGTTQSQYVPDH